MNIVPHFVVPDAAEAAQWYARAFGAREESRIPLPGGKVMTVVLRIGDSTVHVASEFPRAGILSPLAIGGTATVLQINTDDADQLWGRAIGAGAQVDHELAEQFWGERHGQLTDPFGHRWNIAQRVRDVRDDEIAAVAAQIFAGPEPETMRVQELRVSVTVEDHQQAVAFYRDALGLAQLADWSSPDGKVVLLDGGHATLELIDLPQAALIDQAEVGRRVAGTVRLALRASYSQATVSALEHAGAEPLGAIAETPWGDRNVRLRAPDGMQLTLFSSA